MSAIYVYHAALVCSDCAETAMRDIESDHPGIDPSTLGGDDYPQIATGSGESDSPEHCDICGEFLENPLTTDGYRLLAAKLEDALLRCCRGL